MQNSKLAAKKSRPTAQTVVTNTNTRSNQIAPSSDTTDTPGGTDDTVLRRGGGCTKFQSKIPGGTPGQRLTPATVASISTSSTSAPTRKAREIIGIPAFRNEFDRSSTSVDLESESHTQDRNTTQTTTSQSPTSVLDPSDQSRLEEGTLAGKGEFLVSATLFTQSDLFVGEIIEPEAFWRRRKVQRCIFLLCLVTMVGVGWILG
jgi:hypothetical protein